MGLLSLSMLAVFLLLAGAVMTGWIADHLPESVIACSDEGRFASFAGEDHAVTASECGAVSATPHPSAI
ncbi:MAG TPA: hypothetical protein VFR20_02615 [Burkholderiaceae bacterium]|nr:hypothetical protein [Burkholderiaceae bacterium]